MFYDEYGVHLSLVLSLKRDRLAYELMQAKRKIQKLVNFRTKYHSKAGFREMASKNI